MMNSTADPLKKKKSLEKHEKEYTRRLEQTVAQRTQTLRESEARYRSLADSLPQIVFETDEAGRLTFVNRNAYTLFGYTEQDFKNGLYALDMIADQDRDRAGEAIAQVLSGEEVPGIEYTACRRDGSTFPVVIHANRVMRDGRAVGLRGIIIDLTRQKEAEGLLRESEERFRAALHANPDPVVLYDGQGRVVYFNPAFTAIFGWSLEERVGRKMDLFVPEKNWPETKTMIETVMAGKPVRATETCRYDRQGNIIPVIISGAIVHGPTGETVGSIINIRDIREQKKLQTQLAQAQRMEAIGSLAGGIAHDFNNILSAIMGYTELSLADSTLDPGLRDNLQKVKEAGERARDLVKQILTFSRQSEHALIPVQLKPIVTEAFKLLRASLPTTIDIKYQVHTRAAVLADPTQIHQVIMNLCTNAAHAMADEGGSLMVSLTEEALDAAFTLNFPQLTAGPHVVLTVSDTGHGMPPEVLQRIFDPFFTTKKRDQGTGMGLSVVHGIVSSHGGAITVDSKPGQGATFKVYLPVLEKTVSTEQRQDEEPIPTGTERILFVDDEAFLIDIGQQMLERLGYRVTTRASSLEALELFRNRPDDFDLILTDMTMPHLTGDRLAQQILEIRPDIPIILVTGFSNQLSEEKIAAIGIKQLVMKPIILKEIAGVVRDVLDGR